MLLPHNKVSGGVQDSQIMIPSFFDRFYVMPPLTNGVHYKCPSPSLRRAHLHFIFHLKHLLSLFLIDFSHSSPTAMTMYRMASIA